LNFNLTLNLNHNPNPNRDRYRYRCSSRRKWRQQIDENGIDPDLLRHLRLAPSIPISIAMNFSIG
ncbi:hypothetical protein RZS08_28620, partial [Arthrospira platensis SPKY1]|nr:hypothetical protein [Arthrospira platensis SPKY1]